MANEIRLRANNLLGTTTDNPLTNVATVINSPGFVDLPVVNTANHLLLILDPTESAGAAEIVQVTAHAAASSTVTVVRGYDSTTPRQHALGTTWFHGPVASDFSKSFADGAMGQLGYRQTTVAQLNVAASVDVTESFVTVTVRPNRRIRVTGFGQINNDATAGIMLGFIEQDGVSVGRWVVGSIAASGFEYAHGCAVLTPTAGSRTYNLTLQKFSGAGVLNIPAPSADNYVAILVEDIGAV